MRKLSGSGYFGPAACWSTIWSESPADAVADSQKTDAITFAYVLAAGSPGQQDRFCVHMTTFKCFLSPN